MNLKKAPQQATSHHFRIAPGPCSCSGFRGDLRTFRNMGAIKPALVLHYMQHYSLSKISLSDTDTVWLRDPTGTAPCRMHPGILTCTAMMASLYVSC